jgi:hypothetical protein
MIIRISGAWSRAVRRVMGAPGCIRRFGLIRFRSCCRRRWFGVGCRVLLVGCRSMKLVAWLGKGRSGKVEFECRVKSELYISCWGVESSMECSSVCLPLRPSLDSDELYATAPAPTRSGDAELSGSDSVDGLTSRQTSLLGNAYNPLHISSRSPSFSTSTNQMTTLAAKHSAKRSGKPVQLLFVALIIPWTTLGPMILDYFKLVINVRR